MKKYALIFGNDKYEYPNAELKCAVNDACSLEKTFDSLDFEVKKILDSTGYDMSLEIANFENKLKDYDVGVFFFAGHGFQIEGINYLAPVDVRFTDDSTAKYTAFKLDDVLAAMENSKVGIKILIIDACRTIGVTGARGFTSGFAPVNAPRGTIIAFATSPGQIAKESGNHGLFTAALLEHIKTPNITIETVFKRVRNTVYINSKKCQVTWEHTSLMGDFYFSQSKSNEADNPYLACALADSEYTCAAGSRVYDIITDLKSHDYNLQNPAITRFNSISRSLANEDENDLFVLGRNIYQSSDNAFNVTHFMEQLHSNLAKLNKSVRMHILNGMAYEIYFNGNGQLRTNFKIHRYSEVLSELMSFGNEDSLDFIQGQLNEYDKKIIYIPNGKSLKFTCVLVENEEEYYLKAVFFEGVNVLYVENGTELYEYKDSYYYTRRVTKEGLEYDIIQSVAGLSRYVSIDYNLSEISNSKEIVIPYYYQLQNYSS